jgi:hypothetical protein
MIKTEFMDLYEELNSLTENYTLEAHGYKVGDLVEYKDKYYDSQARHWVPTRRHGMVLHLFDNVYSKLIGIWQIGVDDRTYGVADTPVSDIVGKISETDLTPKEKAHYNKYGKQHADRLIKELKADNAEEEKPAEASNDNNATCTKATEPKNAKLNRARQNNIKIIKAFKEVGLPADDLTVTAKNKNGKDYRKASDKLNKLRKTLFGEALDDENVFNQDF